MLTKQISLAMLFLMLSLEMAFSSNEQKLECQQNQYQQLKNLFVKPNKKTKMDIAIVIEPIFSSSWFIKAIDAVAKDGTLFSNRTSAHKYLSDFSENPLPLQEAIAKSLLKELNIIIPKEIRTIGSKSIVDQQAESKLSKLEFEGIIKNWSEYQNENPENFLDAFRSQLEFRSHLVPDELQKEDEWGGYLESKFSDQTKKKSENALLQPTNQVEKKSKIKLAEKKKIEWIESLPSPYFSENKIRDFSTYLSDDEVVSLVDTYLQNSNYKSNSAIFVGSKEFVNLKTGKRFQILKLLEKESFRMNVQQLLYIQKKFSKLFLKESINHLPTTLIRQNFVFDRLVDVHAEYWKSMEEYRKNGNQLRRRIDLGIPMETMELKPGFSLPNYSKVALRNPNWSPDQKAESTMLLNDVRKVLESNAFNEAEKRNALIWFFGQLQALNNMELTEVFFKNRYYDRLVVLALPDTITNFFTSPTLSLDERKYFFQIVQKFLGHLQGAPGSEIANAEKDLYKAIFGTPHSVE